MKSLRKITIIFLSIISLGLTSCGGGGSGSSSSTSGNSSISGTAAVGAPIGNAIVTIYDANGAVVGTTTTNDDGEYSVVVNSGTAPYVVEIVGGVGDAVGKYYAVANETGTVNVNQVSNAIAAALSNSGNPSSLINSPAVAGKIKDIENAFMSAYSKVLAAFGVTGSLISGTFSSTIDEVLDMIDAVILPDGSIELSSSEGQPMPDIMGTFDTNTSPVAHKINLIQVGSLPSSSTANNIPAPTQGVIATAKTLEPLRAKLEKCFSHTAAERATQASASNTSPSWTSIHADCQNLAIDVSSSDGFKHDSYYWIDNSTLNSKNYLSGCANSGSAMCLGFFGSMLTDTGNNNLKFLKPTHIAPIDNNLWRVQFPVVYADDTGT